MGFFPVDPNDGDEIGPNTNGSYFKYVATDNKWILIPNADVYTETEVDALLHAEAHDLASHSTKAHQELTDYNAEENVKHMTDAQINALHARLHAITNILDHNANNHKIFYSDGNGHIIELALGADGEVLTSTGAETAPAFEVAGGGVSQEEFDAINAIGIGNKRWINLGYMGMSLIDVGVAVRNWRNVGADDMSLNLDIPLPYIIGTKNLYITQTKIGIADADEGDEVDRCRWYGTADHTAMAPFLDTGAGLDENTPAEYVWDHADTQIGGVYEKVLLYLQCICTNAADLEIVWAQVEYYYA